jgi:hypothetical protein
VVYGGREHGNRVVTPRPCRKGADAAEATARAAEARREAKVARSAIAATFFYNPTGLRIPLIAIGAMIWTGVAALLHLCAQHVLGRLRSS